MRARNRVGAKTQGSQWQNREKEKICFEKEKTMFTMASFYASFWLESNSIYKHPRPPGRFQSAQVSLEANRG
jgi:hypothetical protein